MSIFAYYLIPQNTNMSNEIELSIAKMPPGFSVDYLHIRTNNQESNFFENQPEYALILSWHYGKNIMKNLRKKGYKGKFIIPMPFPKIIN